MGHQLTGCPTRTGGHGPQLCPHQTPAWQQQAPVVAFAPWATPVSEGPNPLKWWVGNLQTHHVKIMETHAGCPPPVMVPSELGRGSS